MDDTFIANVNKPGGITSRGAMQRVKTLAGADKCGHAGTLDPLACGVLLVCSGRATKVSDLLLDLEKEYVATVRLGQSTDTLDREGPVTGQCPVPPLDGETVERVLARFTGEIWQQPPMYSAVKKGGVPLYKLARRGVVTDRAIRPIRVYRLELISLSLPYMTVRVACSRGTYVRSLCADVAVSLGTCGHLHYLERTKVGRFGIENSLGPDAAGEALNKAIAGAGGGNSPGGVVSAGIYTVDEALGHLPEVFLSPDQVWRLLNGQTIRGTCRETWRGPGGDIRETPESAETCGYTRIKDTSGNLLALGKTSEFGLKMEIMIADGPEYLKQIFKKNS